MYFILVGTKPIQAAAGLVCFDTQDEAAEFMETATALVSFAVPNGGGVRCVDDDDGPPVAIEDLPAWPIGDFPWVEQALAVIANRRDRQVPVAVAVAAKYADATARAIHEAQSRGAATTVAIAEGLRRSLASDAQASAQAGCAHDEVDVQQYDRDIVDVVCRECGTSGSFALSEVEINW